MKKTILTAIAMTCAVGAFAQGTVIFNNRTLGTSHVYAPLSAADHAVIRGQAANDSNPAGTDYGLRPLIGATLGGQYGAQTTLGQLLGANGANQAETLLLPQAGPAVTFRTGTAAGGVASSTATFNNIPKDAAVATLELVAWDNSSGLYSTWTLASVAWQAGQIAAGRSTPFNINLIGGDVNTPPALFPGLTSFNLYFVPEPSSIALAGLGTAAMLIFRRRKQ